ncbi:MAG: sigma-54-dependent Fis family transcriptional regulator [Chthoniobacterales bacterium]|nr:sigma-54-dependent Fis family transcriptional regulator [Chthoniobacterales bacterium]
MPPIEPTRVALVCEGTNPVTESVEELLAELPEFVCERCHYQLGGRIRWPRRTRAGRFDPNVVIVTLNSPKAQGLDELFASLRTTFAGRSVVAIPVQPEGFDVVETLTLGASDFLLPPVRRSELVPRLLRQTLLHGWNETPARELKEKIGLGQIIGESPLLLAEIQRLPRFARADATVLISGESGTGKEVFARALHYLSARADRPFVPINCGAIPEHLVESELFGHKRGAFTGAAFDQPGLVGEADGGTLFLDEIDALTCAAQVKLLRLLQEGEYRAVGSQQFTRADLRVVAAANTDLRKAVSEGKFREDLFYRLCVLTLTLPPLRERQGDVFLLARHFLDRQATSAGENGKNLSLASVNLLLTYPWPGNVRELQNVLTRACVLCDRATIEPCDLDLPDDRAEESDRSFQSMKSDVVRRFERDFLEATLRQHHGNITRAASAVRKSRRAFWELLRKHGLLGAGR